MRAWIVAALLISVPFGWGAPAEASPGDQRELRLALAATNAFRQQSDSGSERTATLARFAAMVTALNEAFDAVGVQFVLVDAPSLVSISDADSISAADGDVSSLQLVSAEWVNGVLDAGDYDLALTFGQTPNQAYVPRVYIAGVCNANASIKGGSVILVEPGFSDARVHELNVHQWGHTLGAWHTFDGTGGACDTNRSSMSSWEPGSGSTIMSYAGLCDSDNLPVGSGDSYFHGGSLEQMQSHLDEMSCGLPAVGTNTPPVVTVPSAAHTIPQQTPFELSGSATDADGDPLLYTWEQMDTGDGNALSAGDTGSNPLFRSYPPVADPVRRFPLGLTAAVGETLPTTNRSMTFRLTARDQRADAGTFGFVELTLDVTTAAGPFTVPSLETLTFGANDVTWDVAGTDAWPVSCAFVTIELSLDGGDTYSVVLEADTPNDGSESVDVPGLGSGSAILRIRCSDNVFYALRQVTLDAFECTTAGECDDGVFCNGEESCGGSACVVGTPVAEGTDCDDGDACTEDTTCDGAGACTGGTLAPACVDAGMPDASVAADGGVTTSDGGANDAGGSVADDAGASVDAGDPVDGDMPDAMAATDASSSADGGRVGMGDGGCGCRVAARRSVGPVFLATFALFTVVLRRRRRRTRSTKSRIAKV